MNEKNLKKILEESVKPLRDGLKRVEKDVQNIKGDVRLVKKDILSIKEEVRSVKVEVVASEQRVINEVGKFLEDQVLTEIDKKADKTDIDRLERKLDLHSAKVVDFETRLTDIESAQESMN